MLLLPATLWANTAKKKIKSVEIKMDAPTPGMDLDDAEKLALKAVNTAYGDLFKSGVITLREISWDGEFGENKKGYPTLKAGYPYIATIQIMIDTNGDYQTDYVMKNGDYVLSPENFKATVNGMPARLLTSAPYFPIMQVTFTIPGGNGGPLKKDHHFLDYDVLKKEYRSTLPYISRKEADEVYPHSHPLDVLVIDKSDMLYEFMHEKYISSSGHAYKNHNTLLMTKMIIDISNGSDNNNISEFAETLGGPYSTTFNLKEVWLSPKVDAVKYVKDLNEATVDRLSKWGRRYMEQSTKLYTAKGTLFIPESAGKAVLDCLALDATEPTYTIRTYRGDVFEAQKAGVAATKLLTCTKHVFTAKIEAADRVCQYNTCKQPFKWFYSCKVCGKCERNKAHTFSGGTGAEVLEWHSMGEDIANDQAYIGVNAAGEHLYWKSCVYCGISHSYHMKHLVPRDQKMMGMDGTFEQYKAGMLENLKSTENMCLLQTTLPSDEMFILPRKSEAKMSVWAQDGVNRALCDNLIDDAVLGNDYTKPVTREQLRSIMTLLVKEMSGKDASASAIGLDDTALPKSGSVTRQELAAYIHRTLLYLEQNSELAYSEYESRLPKYTDHTQIKEWAKEPMAFCNALEVIDPKTATTLAPNEVCTIEFALTTAERATMAHRTGWYQAVSPGELEDFLSPIGERNHYTFVSTFGNGDRIWASRVTNGMYKFLPTTEPFTGARCYVDARALHPIRAKMGKGYMKNANEGIAAVKKIVGGGKKKDKKKGSDIVKKGVKGLLNILK
ncbi:MAG: hypothetical protein EGR08_05010 [Prevotella sp.]|nr:hypothetical protein [Prevotella sp.]